DDPVAGNPLARHTEVLRLMHHGLVDLGERPRVDEKVEALACRFLAGLVLTSDALVPPAKLGRGVTTVQLFEALLEGHRAWTQYRNRARAKSTVSLTFSAFYPDNPYSMSGWLTLV